MSTPKRFYVRKRTVTLQNVRLLGFSIWAIYNQSPLGKVKVKVLLLKSESESASVGIQYMGNLQSESTCRPLQDPLLQQLSSQTTPTRLRWKVKINNQQQTVILINVSTSFDKLRAKEIPTLQVTMLVIFYVFKIF